MSSDIAKCALGGKLAQQSFYYALELMVKLLQGVNTRVTNEGKEGKREGRGREGKGREEVRRYFKKCFSATFLPLVISVPH